MNNSKIPMSDSLELAKRIDESTDIVTGLTNIVQEELPKKSLQGDDEEATNAAILEAVKGIVLDTTDLAKEDTLTQVDDKIDQLLRLFDGVTYENVMSELNTDSNDE